MLEAPSLQQVKEHIRHQRNSLCCIVFAPDFDAVSKTQIIPRLGYLEYRTGEHIHFYLAGYYGYGGEEIYYPDGKALEQYKYADSSVIPWYFSQRKFAEFVDEMELKTSWRYSGGTEVIILNENADFSNAIIFKIDKMIKDGVVDNVNVLFEALIQHSRENKQTIEKFSLNGISKQTGQLFVDGIIELLPKGLQAMSKVWKRGRHYTLDSIE